MIAIPELKSFAILSFLVLVGGLLFLVFKCLEISSVPHRQKNLEELEPQIVFANLIPIYGR